MEGLFWDVKNEDQRKFLIQHIMEMPVPFRAQVKPMGKRTSTQNAAMHAYFRELANALNAAGFDMKAVLKEEAEIPWTEHSVKAHLWKPVQDAMLGTESTTELDKKQVSEVYETLNRHLASKCGVSVQFGVAA